MVALGEEPKKFTVKLTSGHGQTLWVNATTYLPIEAVVLNSNGNYPPAGYHSAKSPGQVIQFSWLVPTCTCSAWPWLRLLWPA